MEKGYSFVLGLLEKHFGKRSARVIVCLILMAFGITHTEIQKKQGAALSTLRRYRRAIDNDDIGSLFVVSERDRERSKLDDFESEIMEEFNAKPPKTLREAQTRIEQITGLKRSLTRLRVWLKKKGLRSLAVGFLPAKANPKEQKSFVADVLSPLVEKAQNGAIELFFLDASHFVMGGFPGRVWSLVRRYVKTASGRKRYNVLGALNFATKRVESVCNDTYITATQVVEMLEKLAASYNHPIHIILDNARYQTCKLVKENALRLGIALHYLPTYSPNLNLIERVWKLVKSKVLNSAYFETFDCFCQNILGCIERLHTDSINDMNTLVTPNFKIIAENHIIDSERLAS